MSPLGSTNKQSAIDTVTCYGCFVFNTMTPPSDRQNWRVNGAGNVCGVIASIIVNPAVINGYTLPLSSTITDGHSYGDVECPFCFYPYILPFIDRFNDGAWTILDVGLTVIFSQNRKFATQHCYASRGQDGGHG